MLFTIFFFLTGEMAEDEDMAKYMKQLHYD